MKKYQDIINNHHKELADDKNSRGREAEIKNTKPTVKNEESKITCRKRPGEVLSLINRHNLLFESHEFVTVRVLCEDPTCFVKSPNQSLGRRNEK